MSESSSADATDFVERALSDVLDAFPREIRAALVARFCAEYAAPMTREMEVALHKRLTDDEVRHLLFCPTPAQYRHYATLLSLHAVAEDGGRADAAAAPIWPRVLCKRFLTLLYLKHARNWPLVTEFVLLDGLDVLAAMFLHTDLQMRGQAIDCFVQITSHTAFDWFAEPVGYEARVLHSKMRALAAPYARFLPSLVENIQSYDPKRSESAAVLTTPGANADGDNNSAPTASLPGGSFVLLQVLAFFLSWLRKFYAANNELCLSSELLELLRDWRARTQSQEPAELELAQQVYEDFSRWPALSLNDGGDAQRDNQSTPLHCQVSQPTTKSAASKFESLFSREDVERLLDGMADNASESQRDADEASALQRCSDAIAARVCLLDAHLLHARALTQRIERVASASAQRSGRKNITAHVYDDVQRVLDDCAHVLQLDTTNVSARKLRVRALAALEMWDEALELLAEWGTTNREALERTFLRDDIAFFRAQHAAATERQRAKAEEAARQQRLDALKQAKQEEIFRAILRRDVAGKSGPAQATTTSEGVAATLDAPCSVELDDSAGSERSAVDLSGASSLDLESEGSLSASASLLAKLTKPRARTKAKVISGVKDPQTERTCRARAFVRKLRQVQADPNALTALLLSTSLEDLTGALESVLSDAQLLAAVDTLVALKRTNSDTTITRSAGKRHTLLTRSKRFQLALEMAPDAVRARLQGCVATQPEECESLAAASVDYHRQTAHDSESESVGSATCA